MKLAEHSNQLATNVEGETQNFGIGDASVVIEILRNRLYENKIQTLTQEYICNARDAHREVGKGNNFEVTVPNRLNPVFKVKDFGPGITPDRMATVFIMYGASTKRGTDNQTGGFGIGAKSAWSYTDSFTIVSTVNGTRRTYVAHTGVNNNGRLDLVSTDETDEPNGTEIQVAVRPEDLDEFRRAIYRATYFWKEKPKFRGELTPPTLVEGFRLGDTLEVIDNNALPEYIRVGSYSDSALAVIDGVPYPIPAKLMHKVQALQDLNTFCTQNVILHFGNGIVEVSASRESIADSAKTLKALEKMAAKALLEAQTYVATEFGKVKETVEYFQTYMRLRKSFDTDNFAKYDDYEIRHGSVSGPTIKKINLTVVHCMDRRGRRIQKITKRECSEMGKEIQVDDMNRLFFVDAAETKVKQNKRIREFLKTNDKMILVTLMTSMVPVKDASNKPVLDKDNRQTYKPDVHKAEYKKFVKDFGVKDFASITYVEEPKIVKEKVKREDAAICMHVVRGGRHEYTTLASNAKQWLYVPYGKDGWTGGYGAQTLRELEDYLSESICGLAPKALKMVKGNKNFQPLQDWLDNFTPSKKDLACIKKDTQLNSGVMEKLAKLKSVDDPEIAEMIEEYKEIEKVKYVKLPDILKDKIKASDDLKEFEKKDKELTGKINTEYSLLNSVENYGYYARNNTRFNEELEFYMNAKYKGQKKGKN